MAKEEKNGENTAKKQKPVMGPDTGVDTRFSTDNQPAPEAKKAGWQELRSRRLLTQAIIKEMFGEDGIPTDSFKGYIKSLVDNAKSGNPKAIETVNNGIEEQKTIQEIILPKLGKDLAEDYV